MAQSNDLEVGLKSGDVSVRKWAVREMGLDSAPESIYLLLRAVRDPHPAVRELAFLKLVEIGVARDPNSLATLVGDWHAHAVAVAQPEEQSIHLRGVFADADRAALATTWQALADGGPEAAERRLLELMSSSKKYPRWDGYPRRNAAGYFLIKLGRTASIVSNNLADLIGEKSGGHVCNSVYALFYPAFHLESNDRSLPDRCSFVTRALPSSSLEVRYAIVEALGPRRAHRSLLDHQGVLSERRHRVHGGGPSDSAYCVAQAIESVAIHFASSPGLLADVAAVSRDYEEANPIRDIAML